MPKTTLNEERGTIRTARSFTNSTNNSPCGKGLLDTCPEPPSDFYPHPQQHPGLSRTLYQGSAGKPRVVLDTCEPQETAHMDYRHGYPTTRDHQPSTWAVDGPLLSAPEQSSSQHTFSVSPSSSPNASTRQETTSGGETIERTRHAHSFTVFAQIKLTFRSSTLDFELLVQAPSQSYEVLRQYVGADSRYTLAAVHAGIYVRTSVQSLDLPGRLKEATIALTWVRNFIRFVHNIPKEQFKPEQKGCLALRVCFSSLTALLGDFSGDTDVHAGDPQAPIVSRSELPTFRRSYSPIMQIMAELSAELGTSVNTYKHRRSPSPSVVLKLQGMLKTLEVWNDCLRDPTFTEPTRIIRTWLDNHPDQVVSARRTRPGSSGQPSPVFSEQRSSPTGQYDTSLFSQSMSDMYGSGQLAPGLGHSRGDANTAGSYLSPSMSYEQSLFVGSASAPTFYAQARGPRASLSAGSHSLSQDPSAYNLDLASIGMYEHMGGSNYPSR
ncbi:hypothetical protein FRC09_008042 [Ceratobasidium sp. 395]|nr:hypothetical protein FRC09_008042 [Ceratobasidium sp. 395]